jgi:hypothetical protein
LGLTEKVNAPETALLILTLDILIGIITFSRIVGEGVLVLMVEELFTTDPVEGQINVPVVTVAAPLTLQLIQAFSST